MNYNYSIPHDPVFVSICKCQSVLTTKGYFPWEKYITFPEIVNTIISGKQNFTGIQPINLTAKIS